MSSNCSIVRTFKRRSGTLDLATGKFKYTKTEIVTEPCGTPLFGGRERESGICNACAKGWSVKDSTFAMEPGEQGRKALTEGVKRGFHNPTSKKFFNLMMKIAGHMNDITKRQAKES